MKKVILCLWALLGFLTLGRSQNLAYYDFKIDTVKVSEAPVYTALTGATAMDTAGAAGQDFGICIFNDTASVKYTNSSMEVEGVNIGFDFKYGAKTYDKFVALGMGYIVLGEKGSEKVKVNMGSNYTQYANSKNCSRLGALFSKSSSSAYSAAISHKLEGTTPNQVLTVEYKNLVYTADHIDSIPLNFQIKLFEYDNHIEFIFDHWFYNTSQLGNMAVGLFDPIAVQLRNPRDFTNPTLATSRATTWNNADCPKGLRYTFTTPAPCTAPTREVSSLSLTPHSNKMDIKVEWGETGDADAYILFASTNPINLTDLDGKEYAKNNVVDGATVLAVNDITGTSFSITHQTLNPNTRYYYAAYLYNYKCSKSKYSSAVKLDTTTLTSAPASVTLNYMAPTLDTLKISVTANSLNEDVAVVLTNRHVVNNNYFWNNAGDFYAPEPTAKVGDTVWTPNHEFAGIVIYKGAAAQNIVCPVQLNVNDAYHIGACSKGANGRYSTLFASCDTVTPIRYPFYFDFSNYVIGQYEAWEDNNGFDLAEPRMGGKITARVDDGVYFNGIFTLPALQFPDDQYTGVFFNFNMPDIYANRFFTKPYEWAESDSVYVEAMIKGDTAWRILKLFTKDSRDRSEGEYTIALKEEYKGKEVRLRFRYETRAVSGSFFQTHSIELTRFDVLPIGLCAYPTHVQAVDVFGDGITLDWRASMMGENAWNLQYALVPATGDYTWSEAVRVQADETQTYRYQLNGLRTSAVEYAVRVQSECGVGLNSQWTEPVIIKSGFKPSFVENFDECEIKETTTWPRISYRALPENWMVMVGPDSIGDTLKAENMTAYTGRFTNYDWLADACHADSNGSLSVNVSQEKSYLMITNPIQFNTGAFADLKMKMAFGVMVDSLNGIAAVDTAKSQYTFSVYVSTDNGQSFITKTPVYTASGNQLAAYGTGKWIEAALPVFTNQNRVRLMLAVQGTNQNENVFLYIDSLSIITHCAQASNLEISNLSDTAATLSWQGDATVSKWTVKLTTDNQVVKQEEVSATTYTFTGLQYSTTYVATVINNCSETEYTDAQIEFTTAGKSCDPVSEITVTGITRNSAVISWNGDADNYRLRIRPVSETPAAWTVIPVNGAKTYNLTNLLKNTQYEGAVQSRCSEAVSDTSEYVAFETFTTLDITCFAPTEVSARALDYKSALVKWTGTSAAYQVRYTKTAPAVPAYTYVSVEADSAVIKGLESEVEYAFTVRGVCAVGDTSDWSEAAYATIPVHVCPVPTNLTVESKDSVSAVLSWEMEEEFTDFIFRYRNASVSAWDSVKNLTVKTYTLTGLEPQTVYLWSVMAQCIDGVYSGWGTQNRFETDSSYIEPVRNEDNIAAGMYITAARNQVRLMNPGAVNIDRVRIYTTAGRLAETYEVRSNQNAILTTALRQQVVIVSVESGDKAVRFKVLLP